MKKGRIKFLVTLAIISFCHVSYSQQKASDKSWETLMNQLKQQRAKREQMLQREKLTTPSAFNLEAQSGNSRQVNATTVQQTPATTTAKPATESTHSNQQVNPTMQTIKKQHE